MSFREKAAETSKNSGNGQSEYEGIDVDMDEVAWVKMQPTTFLTGVFPEDEGNPIIRFAAPDNNDGRLDQGYLGMVLDDPEVLIEEDEGTSNTVILDREGTSEYRLFNEDDRGTEVEESFTKDDDGEVVQDGYDVSFNAGQGERTYSGDVVDEIEEDRVILTIGGTASKGVAKSIDVKGALAADMDPEEGNPNDGLIEYMPDDERSGSESYTSRYARDPELKDQLYGTRVGFFLARREEIDEDFAEEVEEGNRRSMYWWTVFNTETEEVMEPETTDTEPLQYSYLEWRWDPSDGAGLPEEHYEYVTEYADAAQQDGGPGTDEDTIRSHIEDDMETFDEEPDEDTIEQMVERIQSQAA
jgi:hypothetical protein